MDEVLEKEDIASKVASIYSRLPLTPLAEILYGQGERKQIDLQPNEKGEVPAKLLDTQYRVVFAVVGVQPGNLYELC